MADNKKIVIRWDMSLTGEADRKRVERLHDWIGKRGSSAPAGATDLIDHEQIVVEEDQASLIRGWVEKLPGWKGGPDLLRFERVGENPPRFQLGRLMSTPGAIRTMNRREITPLSLLKRHMSGDWGELETEDWEENEYSVSRDLRILSGYGEGEDRLWVITEADRSATTILRPSEY